MSALPAEASQNLAARPPQVSPDISSPLEGGNLLSLDPDVAFRQYKPNGDLDEGKRIAYLGMIELQRPGQPCTIGARLGGGFMVFGSYKDTFEELYQKAINAKIEHLAFYIGMELDIAQTMENPSRYSPLDHRGIMDLFWIMNNGVRQSNIVHPSRKQPFNEGARRYTADLLSLVIPLHLPPK